MKKITFSIDINAPKEKVWYSLWDEENYENWTSAFSEGSHAISDWNEGSKIYFLGSGGGGGMSSKINIKEPFNIMSFKHMTEIKDFKELPITKETESWSGSEERYDLSENNGITTVTVTIDVVEKFANYFSETFPKALQKLKEIAESETKSITVRISTKENLEKVWDYFTQPKHIVNWNNASDDWHCPKSENDLKVGGTFTATMASKDGAMSFDFMGTYTEVAPMKKFVYTIADGRKVTVKFDVLDGNVILTENFEPENVHSIELQRGGWQAILDNFKKYLENN
ncbi:SRPBCC domain-containing protein [Flavobacterium sp.]|uniref:SRPBCC domain-containing protein n=1 Tax=Flavobacterium sp. TaxID=239 RepID=UPI00286B733F|nr:SRPBCC domain-containing protein [Flavobacterium sp.]